MATLSVFSNVLRSLRVSPDSSVGMSCNECYRSITFMYTMTGLAVSGGCDSLALALLARQYFKNRIVGITVDHQ